MPPTRRQRLQRATQQRLGKGVTQLSRKTQPLDKDALVSELHDSLAKPFKKLESLEPLSWAGCFRCKWRQLEVHCLTGEFAG